MHHGAPDTRLPRLKALRALLSAYWLVILFVPIMYHLKECYPFSHFPMYSNLGEIWTLKLTDENNNVISTQNDFIGRPNSIRKLTWARVRQVIKERGLSSKTLRPTDWHEASQRTFKWLLQNHKPRPQIQSIKALRLWKMDMQLVSGKFQRTYTLLIEHPMPGHDYIPAADLTTVAPPIGSYMDEEPTTDNQ